MSLGLDDPSWMTVGVHRATGTLTDRLSLEKEAHSEHGCGAGNGADRLLGNLCTCGTRTWSRRQPEDPSDTIRVATRTRPKPGLWPTGWLRGVHGIRHWAIPKGTGLSSRIRPTSTAASGGLQAPTAMAVTEHGRVAFDRLCYWRWLASLLTTGHERSTDTTVAVTAVDVTLGSPCAPAGWPPPGASAARPPRSRERVPSRPWWWR